MSNSIVYIGVYMKKSFTLCDCTVHLQLAPPSSLNIHVIHAQDQVKI